MKNSFDGPFTVPQFSNNTIRKDRAYFCIRNQSRMENQVLGEAFTQVVGRQNLLAVFVMFLMGSVRLRAGCSLLISYRNISLDSSQNRRSPWQVTLKADPDFDKYLYVFQILCTVAWQPKKLSSEVGSTNIFYTLVQCRKLTIIRNYLLNVNRRIVFQPSKQQFFLQKKVFS